MQRVGRRSQPKGFLRLRLSFGFAFSFDFTSFALVAFFFVYVVVVVVAFALALFVGFSCCCFFPSPSRLSDFQVMSFFLLPSPRMDCPPDGLLPSERHVICGCVCECVLGCGSGDGLCLYYKGYWANHHDSGRRIKPAMKSSLLA